MLPPLIIEDVASALCLSESGHCMVLTKTGLFHMWNIEKKKCVINRASVRCLLSKKGKKLLHIVLTQFSTITGS